MSRLLNLTLLAACLLGCLSGNAFAQDEPSKSKEDSTAKTEQNPDQTEENSLNTFQDVKADFKNKVKAFSKRYRAATTNAEKRKVTRTRPSIKQYKAKLIELFSEASATSEETQKTASWWYHCNRSNGDAHVVLQVLIDNFAKEKLMAEHVFKLPLKFPEKEAEKHLRSLIDINPFDVVKARSTYYLRRMLVDRVKSLEGEKAETVNTEIKSLGNLLSTKYADQVESGGLRFADLITAEEFELKLAIGKPVPDIVGTDIDGVEFKLSDYHGKVTMISFWGFW